MSSQDEGWRPPDDPQWSGEPAEAPDILEQGRNGPPARWPLAGRWRRPPTVAISLGVAGLLVGLGAGYAAGTLHTEKAPVSSARPIATASPAAISPILIGGPQLPCSATGMLSQLNTTARNVSPPPAHGTVIVIFPSGRVVLTCRQ